MVCGTHCAHRVSPTLAHCSIAHRTIAPYTRESAHEHQRTPAPGYTSLYSKVKHYRLARVHTEDVCIYMYILPIVS